MFRCECGKTCRKRPTDVLRGQIECGSCAASRRSKAIASTEKGRAKLIEAPSKAVMMAQVTKEWSNLRKRCQSAINRCTNRNSKAFKNYGGRGIKVAFASASDMARWIVDNLGYPEKYSSLDRIDNDKDYAPGNLRWASIKEQANNKRAYVGNVYGGRIRQLRQDRPDITYETIRTWIKEGMTDDEIRTRPKSSSGRPRVRHS